MMLRVARIEPHVTVLGPGTRTVIWVQGCPLRCRECIAPDMLALDGGRDLPTDEVAAIVCEHAGDGLTVSGGEPFMQAGAVMRVIDTVRESDPDHSVMLYSGYPLRHLQRRGSDSQRMLLARADILVDGPYLPQKHAPLRWRGSTNQGLRFLSPRHADVAHEADVSAGVEVIVSHGRVTWAGVPPQHGMMEAVERSLAAGLAGERTPGGDS